LNEQGRAQLKRTWGKAKDPDCAGFTMAELQGLDFARIDLSEFYAEIAPTLPNSEALGQQARQRVNAYFEK
jgi:conjugal transfer mating pair stabilization protein TraN